MRGMARLFNFVYIVTFTALSVCSRGIFPFLPSETAIRLPARCQWGGRANSRGTSLSRRGMHKPSLRPTPKDMPRSRRTCIVS